MIYDKSSLVPLPRLFSVINRARSINAHLSDDPNAKLPRRHAPYISQSALPRFRPPFTPDNNEIPPSSRLPLPPPLTLSFFHGVRAK
ncbi:hypothetical protein PUN28_006744 [Cardiocondyla obscurior]|uniref:Uncharacterized protein n=1 Tax=Cardiocondyla obscurior TaxID=286306 RepID=A0AAW2G5L7_9HYME